MAGVLVNELFKNRIPVHQFVEAMQGEAGFSRENVEAFLVAKGLPPSPESWRQAIDDSVLQNTRLMLDQKGLEGLDGSGVTVRVLEPYDSIHGDVVAALINHTDFGLAPGAVVEKSFEMSSVPDGTPHDLIKQALRQNFAYEINRLWQEAGSPSSGFDNPELAKKAFGHAVSNMAAQGTFEGTTEQIRDFTHSDASVLNMSMGNSFSSLLMPTLEIAADLVASSPQLQRALIPDPSKFNAVQFNQQITDFVAQAAFNGQESTQSHRDYVQATKEAAEAGKVIVVAAANEQEHVEKLKQLGLTLPDLAAFNALGMSDYVIAVGASKTNGTPRNVVDDSVADFSSQGGTGYGVTTTTQGTHHAVPYTQYIELGGQVDGTSFAAPTVAATVALLKQYKPDATFDEIKAWLVSHSVDTAASANAEGAGMLNLPGAVANA